MNSKFLILIFTLVLAVVLCGAVSAATTTSYSSNGKIVKITSTYGKSVLQTHVITNKKNGPYGYGTYATVTYGGKDIKGRTTFRTINYFNNVFKTDSYKLTDHRGFEYNSKSTSGLSKIFGTVSGKLNSGITFNGTNIATVYYVKNQKLIKNSTGILKFWQNGKLFAKIIIVDIPQYKLYNGDHQLIKVTETSTTLYTNGNTRKSVISSYYTRNSRGVLKGQKTLGTSSGSEKINNKIVKYTGKISISTKYDPNDAYNEKYVFGDYTEVKTSSSSRLLKIYPFEAINFS